jgi:hypothetical protein
MVVLCWLHLVNTVTSDDLKTLSFFVWVRPLIKYKSFDKHNVELLANEGVRCSNYKFSDSSHCKFPRAAQWLLR